MTPSAEFDAPVCGCPTIENGDVRCHICGEYVNKRCWKCGSLRGAGTCPIPPEEGDHTSQGEN